MYVSLKIVLRATVCFVKYKKKINKNKKILLAASVHLIEDITHEVLRCSTVYMQQT
jgi:hypothetical protein